MFETMLRRAAVNAALLARSSKPHCSAQSMLTVLSDTMQYAPVAYIQVRFHVDHCVPGCI